MKRILAALAALTLVAMLAALPALAEGAGRDLVVDDAGLLTAEERADLEARAREITETCGMDVAIYTAQSAGGKSVMAFADDYYDENGYADDGVMLVLCMADRDWWIATKGEGIRDFTDYGIQRMGEDFVPDLSEGNYARAFRRYLDDAETFIHEARENQPFDTNHTYNGVPLSTGQKLTGSLPVAGVLSLLTSLIGVGRMKSGLRTARPKHGAARYANRDSLQVTRAQDIFLYHTQMRQRLPEPSSSGGGGSSTHISSSGSTHGGGGGKF